MLKKIIIITISILLLTSCYDYKEINNITIVKCVEINQTKYNYHVLVEAIEIKNKEKSSIIYESVGITIQEALRKIDETSPKYLYSNHLDLLILDKNEYLNIKEIIDFFLRNPSTRSEFYIILSEKENILKNINNPNKEIISTNIKNTIDNNIKYLSSTTSLTFNDLTNNILNNNIDLILPIIKLNHENNYLVEGLQIYKNQNYYNYLNTENTIIYNIINNKINNTIITIPLKDNNISIEINKNNSSLTFKNKIIFNINISGNISEYNGSLDLNQNKNITLIEESINKYLKELLSNQLKELYLNKLDIYGIKDLLYKNNITISDKYINSENIEININCQIKEKGNISNSNEKNI